MCKLSGNGSATKQEVPEFHELLQELYERSAEGLDSFQKEKLHELLADFEDIFSKGAQDLGRTSLTSHGIDTGDSRPIRQPPRRLPISQMEEARKAVETMVRDGVIERSNSPWKAPVVLVKKKDGTTRFCVDYRKTPHNKKELRSSLGLSSYYRKFVPAFSVVASPLHKLTEKNVEFQWSGECDDAFRKLKGLLTNTPIFAYPLPKGKFIIDTDASHFGIGAVLSQEQNSQERVIAYFSRSLSRAERNYCVTREELLAVVKAVEKFHYYLYGQKFTVRTDHSSLRWLLNFRQPEGLCIDPNILILIKIL